METLTLAQALDSAQAHHRAGRLTEAEALYRHVLQHVPEEPYALHGLGLLAHRAGRSDLAAAWIGRALARMPREANFHNSFGEVQRLAGQLAEAEASFRRALALDSRSAEAHSNLGIVLARRNALPEAIVAFEQAIALHPNHANAHDGLGLTLLLAGDFQRGWHEQEWRWQKENLALLRRQFAEPEWDGSPLAGRTLLAHAEQGFGDTIQFARCVRGLVAGGASVVFEVQPELWPLFGGRAEFGQVIRRGDPLPRFDVHRALMTLPLLLGTTLETVPAEVPYLESDAARVEKLRRAWSPEGVPLVGLVWAGRPEHPEDRARSLTAAQYYPLAGVAGVRFVSLQKGPAATVGLPPALRAIDGAPLLPDFSATRDALAALDLLISADTSVVHLAGALARPVWTLLPFSPDWRWMLERRDTPWYPTMRLYRQATRGDWAGVIREVAADLHRRFLAL